MRHTAAKTQLDRRAGGASRQAWTHDRLIPIMTDALIQIRNPEVVRDIRALAERMGLPLTDAVADAVRRRLAEENAKAPPSPGDRKRRVRELVTAFRSLPKVGPALTDNDLYDENGFPR